MIVEIRILDLVLGCILLFFLYICMYLFGWIVRDNKEKVIKK